MTSLRKLSTRVKSRCPKFLHSTIDFVFYEFMSWINECSTFSKGWFEFWHGYVCENKCESDRDSLLIVVKVFSLRSARSFTSTCQLLHTHQPVAKSSLVQGNGVKYFLTENSYFHKIQHIHEIFPVFLWSHHQMFLRVKDWAEWSVKTLTTTSKELPSDSHLFSHIPMPKLKLTLVKMGLYENRHIALYLRNYLNPLRTVRVYFLSQMWADLQVIYHT